MTKQYIIKIYKINKIITMIKLNNFGMVFKIEKKNIFNKKYYICNYRK